MALEILPQCHTTQTKEKQNRAGGAEQPQGAETLSARSARAAGHRPRPPGPAPARVQPALLGAGWGLHGHESCGLTYFTRPSGKQILHLAGLMLTAPPASPPGLPQRGPEGTHPLTPGGRPRSRGPGRGAGARSYRASGGLRRRPAPSPAPRLLHPKTRPSRKGPGRTRPAGPAPAPPPGEPRLPGWPRLRLGPRPPPGRPVCDPR